MAATSWMRLVGEAFAVAAGVVLVVAAGARYLSPGAPAASAAEGARLERSVGIDFRAADRTVILFLQSDCRFCRVSTPFYRRLTVRDTTGVQIVVAAPAVDAGMRRYLTAHAIEPDAVIYVEQGELPVSATPTVLAVDSDGRVTHAWAGWLDAGQEADVLSVLFG